MTIVFRILKKTVGLRVTKQEEIEGLDIHEHGLSSGYADFMPVTEFRAFAADLPSSLPVAVRSGSAGEPSAEEQSSTKFTVIINSDRFEELKKVLAGIGINGMTVTQVMGCGAQKGISRYYRGVSVTANLLPKIKIEIIINSVSADNVISTIRNTISSGNIGDGKIFIYDVENVVRIRNGESGIRALQDDSES